MTKPITKIAIEAGDQDVIAAYLRRLAEEFERNRRLVDSDHAIRVELATTIRGETVKVCGVVW